MSAGRDYAIESRALKPGDRIATESWAGGTISHRKDDDTGWWLTDKGGVSDAVFDFNPRIQAHRYFKVVVDDEVTITVSRRDLDDVLHFAKVRGSGATGVKVRRIQAAIPAPPWEPTDEQIKAYRDAFPQVWTPRAALKRLHAAGLVLP